MIKGKIISIHPTMNKRRRCSPLSAKTDRCGLRAMYRKFLKSWDVVQRRTCSATLWIFVVPLVAETKRRTVKTGINVWVSVSVSVKNGIGRQWTVGYQELSRIPDSWSFFFGQVWGFWKSFSLNLGFGPWLQCWVGPLSIFFVKQIYF